MCLRGVDVFAISERFEGGPLKFRGEKDFVFFFLNQEVGVLPSYMHPDLAEDPQHHSSYLDTTAERAHGFEGLTLVPLAVSIVCAIFLVQQKCAAKLSRSIEYVVCRTPDRAAVVCACCCLLLDPDEYFVDGYLCLPVSCLCVRKLCLL